MICTEEQIPAPHDDPRTHDRKQMIGVFVLIPALLCVGAASLLTTWLFSSALLAPTTTFFLGLALLVAGGLSYRRHGKMSSYGGRFPTDPVGYSQVATSATLDLACVGTGVGMSGTSLALVLVGNNPGAWTSTGLLACALVVALSPVLAFLVVECFPWWGKRVADIGANLRGRVAGIGADRADPWEFGSEDGL